MKFCGKIKILWTFMVFICTGSVLWAQSPSGQDSKNSNAGKSNASNTVERGLRVETLIALARSAPPEVAADVVLTIASSNQINRKQRKIELIEEAFRIAAQAREPIKQRSWGLAVDTRSGFKQRAFELELDKLSIQSKSVMQMIPLDRLRARVMFESITLPPIKLLTCGDSLVDDLDSYYQAMLSVAEQCFSDEEKKAAAQIQFLSDRIDGTRSVPQITPALRMALNAKVSPDEFSWLAHVLTKALGRVANDPRSFAFAVERDVFVSTAHKLILKLKQYGLPASDFGNETRKFLIKNMSAEVCLDAGWIKLGQASLPPDVERMNGELAAPITADDIKPARFGPQAANVDYWTTPKARALLKLARELRFGGSTTALSSEQRLTEEWHQKLLAFLDLIDSWDPASEPSPDDYFQEKCSMYRVLVDLCPDDLQRDAVLRLYGSYLKESSGTYKGRIDWILPVKDYLHMLRWKSEQVRQSSLEPWLSSSDGSLRIYGELALLIGAKG